jgi:acetoin utilization deacetylase AcuC-like enzyme
MSMPGTEVAERVTRIERAVQQAGCPVVPATAHNDRTLLSVHDHDLVEHLRTAWDSWTAGGYPQLGADRVVPYFFPGDEVRHGLPQRIPTAVHAQVGLYCYDTMTTLGPGSWEAIRGAVDAALTAVDLVVAGAPLAYALTRPPGHHATRRGYGGSCYLNNAGVAAQALRDAGHERVAVIDIDAHHGNGTQSLFYDREDVLYASVHVDPGAGWFPHVVGFADETGRGAGTGANVNVPLPPGSGDVPWLAAVERCTDLATSRGATALVVSLGVDAAADDPESPLQVTADGYHGAGALLARLGLPTVAVQEGGYHLDSLGGLVLATLTGLAGGR